MSAGELGRHGLRVRGTVQGVGFRPFVHRLATEHALAGYVRNDNDGVWIEVEGSRCELAGFEARLRSEAPPLARVLSIELLELAPLAAGGFAILSSASAASVQTNIPCDSAPCAACLEELADPRDRRYRYPFINCTACGPRYTLVRGLPYDRARTTMSSFTLCAACRSEYEQPSDRRFHAEPTACPACGPALRLVDAAGTDRGGADPLEAAARAVADGRILALKGVGGYLLAANARDAAAVARLRTRKRRPHKPFALMARDLDELELWVELSPLARSALTAPERPIVLLPRRRGAPAAALAPGLAELGVMLPSTPLHVLLLGAGPPAQVMTSGNAGDEPIAIEDADALERLRSIADLFLLHDRAIHTRLDDSVLRVSAGELQPLRRARGFVPEPIALPIAGPELIATGAQLKNVVCITRGGAAYLSQHIGDLDSPRARALFEETIEKLAGLLDVAPRVVAHDLHPDYFCTRWARASRLSCVPVQHHHAHVAACLAEHDRRGPAIGVAFDGTGCGLEGEIWGGELLVAGLAEFRRAGHLRALALPGGEAAIRQPWRVGVAALVDAGVAPAEFFQVKPGRRAALERMIAQRVATPSATSAGRWFDAVAAITGVRHEISYEGQAAIELEALAAPGAHEPYPVALQSGGERDLFVVDLRPTVRAIAADVRASIQVAEISARFHETLARVIAGACRRERERTGLELVALSGGCFQNRRLSERTRELLGSEGFEVLTHRRVPPSDGGIALGQAAVASCRRWQEARKG